MVRQALLYFNLGILSQSILYLQFYLYSIGKIVNKQKIVCNNIPGLSFGADGSASSLVFGSLYVRFLAPVHSFTNCQLLVKG